MNTEAQARRHSGSRSACLDRAPRPGPRGTVEDTSRRTRDAVERWKHVETEERKEYTAMHLRHSAYVVCFDRDLFFWENDKLRGGGDSFLVCRNMFHSRSCVKTNYV